MRIDCQSHVFPQGYIDVLSQNPVPPNIHQDAGSYLITYGDIQSFRLFPEAYSVQQKLSAMDESKIDISLISTNIPGPCMLVSELSVAGAKAINNFIAELTQKHPDRLAGLASIPWNLPEEAIREMTRAKVELGFCGAMLYSHINGRSVDDPDFEPIYAHAATLDMPIVLHPTIPTWGEKIMEYSMIPMMGFQVDTSFALLRLILSGILERNPSLRIVIPHAGGVLPYMMGRIDHQTEVLGRARDNITQPVSMYMKDIYLDTVSPSRQALEYAYEFSGPNRLLFGSDHPWVFPKIFVDIINKMKISDLDKEKIYYQNAKSLFDIG